MNKRYQKRRSLRVTLLLVLLTAILLVSSSYAWFTANQTVTVNELEVNVAAQNGLQISVDGINWKSVISKDELVQTAVTSTYPTAVNKIPSTLAPVSTIGDIDTTTGYMKMFNGNVVDGEDGNPILTAEQSEETADSTNYYIAFDLFLSVQKTTKLYMTGTSNVVSTDATTKGMENAARVAFVDQGYTAAGSPTSTIQGLKGATNASRYIWEPNYDTHTAAGVANGNAVYGSNLTISTEEQAKLTDGTLKEIKDRAQLAYHGVKADIADTAKVKLDETTTDTNSGLFSAVTTSYATKKGFTDQVEIFTLQPGITKVRVYMWIEGQDIDCENNASGSNIAYNLQFTIAEPVSGT